MTMEDTATTTRRAQRLARYDELRAERPHMFVNPPNAAYEIVLDPGDQARVADESADRLRDAGKPAEYGDVGVIYEDSYVIAFRDAVRFRDGRLGPYIRLIKADLGTAALVLPMLADGRVVLVRHFRHELRAWQWEIPGGFAEAGADGATTAVRELEEELGVVVDAVDLLGTVAEEEGNDEIYLARFEADALPREAPAGAVEEGIDERRLVTWPELSAMIAAGEVTDGKVLAAFALATARGIA
jgi:ADP-ribose diphosphatase